MYTRNGVNTKSRVIENNERKIKNCIIGEDKDDPRYFKIFPNGEFKKVEIPSDATIFGSILRANEAMEKVGIENFGIAFYSVTKKPSGKLAMNLKVSTDHIFNLQELSSNDVKLWLYNDEMFSYFDVDRKDIYENKEKVKHEIFIKIGLLIDFHARGIEKFTKTINQDGSIRKEACPGCAVCDEIYELAAFLEIPQLKKLYKVFTYQDVNRYKKYNMNDLDDLAKMYSDFVPLRIEGFSFSKIAGFYGISKQKHKDNYDKLVDSKYHTVIGRKWRGLIPSDKRTLIDVA